MTKALRNLWNGEMYFWLINYIELLCLLKFKLIDVEGKPKILKSFRQGRWHVFLYRQLYWGYYKGTVARFIEDFDLDLST